MIDDEPAIAKTQLINRALTALLLRRALPSGLLTSTHPFPIYKAGLLCRNLFLSNRSEEV